MLNMQIVVENNDNRFSVNNVHNKKVDEKKVVKIKLSTALSCDFIFYYE